MDWNFEKTKPRTRRRSSLGKFLAKNFPFVCEKHYTVLPPPKLKAGQSRLTLVTGNEGCVRYPTEGNNSNHELTTAMQHLSNCLAAIDVSAYLQLDF